jgi:FAD:protein FMN transferase
MGTEIRVFVGSRLDAAASSPDLAAIEIQAQLVDFDRRLSRFRPDSELSLLNGDPREEVPASNLLRMALKAGVWAAERSDGLVDPTLLAQLEAAGYARSFEGQRSAPLAEALKSAPPRRPANSNPDAPWRSFEVVDGAGAIRRPQGLLFDTGGIGKGLAADLVAQRLGAYARYAVDLGGDVRVGGMEPESEPVEIEVRHPLSGESAERFRVERGAVATSGLDARLWSRPDGSHGHHLIDPSTGEPAWTGLICASARAPTAIEADALAKFALLSGEDGARAVLAEHGGLMVRDDGSVESVAARGGLRLNPAAITEDC